MDDCTKVRYDKILGRDLLPELWLIKKLFEHVIETEIGSLRCQTASMVDFGMYEYNALNKWYIAPV